MDSENKVDGWWAYLRVILVKSIWKFLATGTFFTSLFVITWWRDNFAPDPWKKRLELRGLLPHWHPAVWLCISLILLLWLSLRRTYELWKQQVEELRRFRILPAPEFVIDFAEEGDEVIGFKLRNTSQHNLYNVMIANMQSRVGEIGWWNNYFTCIEARIGEIVLTPASPIDSSIRFHDVPALKKALSETTGGENPETVGTLRVFADDAEGNRFRFSTDIQLWNGWTWRVWETERILVKTKGG